MALDLYTTRQLYKVMYDDRLEVAPTWFLDTYFAGAAYLSTTEEIVFSKLPSRRKIAPFMLPNEQGKPIYRRQGETLQSFKPAYTKPKDAVRPSEMIKRMPGEILTGTVTGGAVVTPKQRYDAEVLRIATFHRQAINRLWDLMAAKAILDGYIDVNYSTDGAHVINSRVDFGRDAGHTILLGAGARWGDAGVSIIDYINSWIATMAGAAYGGTATRLVLGPLAYAKFAKDAEIKDLLDNFYSGAENVNLRRGVIETGDPEQPATYIGKISANIEVWIYSGTFQNDDGSLVQVMDPRDILLTAPGVEGLKCFGAILDDDADLAAIEIFPKMWKQEDPSARFIMTQSAPLMIPVNPNRTLRARVVA